MSESRKAVSRSSLIQTIKAVFWSFAGVRRRAEYQRDTTSLNPVHVVIAGIIGGVMFVLTIVSIVALVVS